MVNNIKYSIIITTYNYENFLKLCLDSCLQQTKKLIYEIILVNDGSTDNTENILKSYNSPLLKCFTIPNCGIEAASNFGFKKARGTYLVRVDADDMLSPNYLEIMDSYIDDSKNKFYFPNYSIIDKKRKKIEIISLPIYNKEEVLERGDFLATGTIYRKDYIEKVGFYSECYKNTGLENYELILNLLSLGVEGERIPEVLFFYRRHNLNMSELKRDKIINYGIELFQRFNLGRYSTNKNHPYKLKIK